MNAKIDALFSDYCSILDDYRLNINEKNATNFEDSLICKNDIETILKGKFDNIRFSFEEGKEKVSSLKKHFSATDYENTIEMINRFISLSNSYISLIEDTNKQIEVASKAAYEEYCKEFKNYQDDYLHYVDVINAGFALCDNCTEKLRDLQEKRNLSTGQFIVPNSLLSEIEEYENIRASAYNSLVTNMSQIRKDCRELKRILEIALKKGTAV